MNKKYLLSNHDYKKILKYYKKPIPKKITLVRTKVEDILASKLCGCIKKIEKTRKNKKNIKAIGICRNSVMTRKKLGYYQFTCKNKAKFKTKSKKKIYKLNS